jgi:hypothetical protein
MEARRCVEFTGIELAGDAELIASVKKAAIGLVEKATAGHSDGEEAMEREKNKQPHWGAVEMPASGRCLDA